MKSGHLILGELVDFITGETIEDTHDERYRQKLARLFVEKKGYNKNEIKSRCELPVSAGANKAVVKIDFLVTLSDKICMIIKYSPGSLVTRHRPVLAASRLVAPYQIPIAVITNGEDADVLDGYTNEVISSGFESIPDKQQLTKRVADIHLEPISSRRAEMESRIIYAFEIDGSCSL
ncbi:MAG: type I restriction enzyme HsdR N-terminal domain-containing protein [Deltaproteobacteria bacterium]|nr:type I restriction enzyme HsdR N-terminal domain-containing protein [Deltaproteobacteria bacterium]